MKWLSVVAAVVLVVLVMHPGGGSTLDIFPLVSCSPDCTGVENGGKVPDPFNCTNYYICMNGVPTDHSVPCDAGNIFNPETAACEVGTECTPICAPGGGGCPLSCNGTLSVIADALDCSVYYYCTPSGPVPDKCPDSLPNFDGENCVNDESVCCTGYCEPYCNGDGVFAFIPDPVNCTLYYACDENAAEGPPDESFHFKCPPGQIFDVARLICVDGDASTCVTLCDAAGGGGGGSTTSGSGGGSTTSGSGGGSTTTSGGSSGCVSSLTCPDEGYYAACDTCVPQYFDCASAGAAGVLTTCPDGTLFNPNPEYPICVMETNCPYS